MNATRIVLGTRKGLLIFQQDGGRWQRVAEAHVGARVSYAVTDPRSEMLYACIDHGHWGCKLQRSRDGGTTWQELATPKYPEGALIKPEKPAVLTYQWCLEPGPATQPGRLYMGTVPGGLFTSDDHGDSWQLNEGLWNQPSRFEHWFGGGMNEPGIHSVAIDPRDSQVIRVGISCAGMFITRDGGQTWSPSNKGCKAEYLPNPDVDVGHDPHLLVQCAAEPDKLWQQNHCGIFRSTDGANWEAASRAGESPHFGFTVAVDPQHGDTAWVVPAEADERRVAVERKLCVCRTENGGRTWQTFRAGLPQQDCYDFAFRHCLDIRGDALVLGTAGGALYLSTDRGESWQALAEHLPPIYSVKWSH
jgi:photosystem II stability/assembly factor-like uncharacterized protein